MERSEIFDHIENLWDKCQDRNLGSNEAELDFKESVADWISLNFTECKEETGIKVAVIGPGYMVDQHREIIK